MAITATKLFHTVFGDKQAGCYKITGDGTTTTWTAPIAAIDCAISQEGTNTEASANNMITWSGATVTWGAAIDTGTYNYLFYFGI